jgi:monoamine oxidase
MTEPKKGLTRRRFLERVGMAGGSVALYETMTALGLINVPTAWAGPPRLPPGSGEGKTVVILGAGIGGMTAAYELVRAGYRCQILEGTERAGGRNHTARRGDVFIEEPEDGPRTTQVCNFDEGLYLNMGPGRLPYHHRRVLHYCQQLGVALEVYVMETMANLFQTSKAFKGQPQIKRRINYDMQGYIAEMLAKAVSQKALNESFNDGDRDKLLCLLQTFGDLGEGEVCDSCGKSKGTCIHYTGSTRSGCEDILTVYDPCKPETRLNLQDLLNSEFWMNRFYQSFEYEWQPTLFQPVGGMDKIVDGFKRKIGDLISYQSTVTEIQIGKDNVSVAYTYGFNREPRKVTADYCISNIPIPLLQKKANKIKANFSDAYRKAVEQGRYGKTCKLGWQANERFWESDKYEIYGGISYTDDMITQMWYPSYDYFTKNGTLTGVYNYDDDADKFGKMSLAERIINARAGAIKLHPEFADERLVPSDKALSIAWHNIASERGGWAVWNSDSAADAEAYTELLSPDGNRFFMVGDQVSPLPGWQEGAMMSAQHVVEEIDSLNRLHAPMSVPKVKRAPDTRRLVQGR